MADINKYDIIVLEDDGCPKVNEISWPEGLFAIICYSGNVRGADLTGPSFRISLSSSLVGDPAFSSDFSGAVVFISGSLAESLGCPDCLIEDIQNSGGGIAGNISATESVTIKRYVSLLMGCDCSSGGDLTEAGNLAMALIYHLAGIVQ